MKKLSCLLMTVILIIGTLPVFAFAGNDSNEDFSTATISEKNIQVIREAGGIRVGATGSFNPTATLATWAMNKALNSSFEGIMDVIFGGEGSSVDSEILKNLEQINLKLDQVLQNQQQMAAAINVMQNTVAITDIQGYLNQYTKLITKTNMSVKNIWNSVEDIEKNAEAKPASEKEAYLQKELLSLFTDQMGASSQTPENAETVMDDMFRTIYSCITTPYGITLNGKPASTNLFGLYYEYARLAYPWENKEALNAIRNYNDALYCQYMMIAILESISLETRINACEELGHGCTRLNQMLNNEINDSIEEITKDYQSRADYADKAENDNYKRLWHPAYNISFNKDVYETALPTETSNKAAGVSYSGGKYVVNKEFWKKMNLPKEGSLPQNVTVAKSAEISAIYNVYQNFAPGTSLIQMLKQGELNVPSAADSDTSIMVLNVDDPQYPLKEEDTKVTIRGNKLYATQPSYNIIPTYLYTPVVNRAIPINVCNKSARYFLLGVTTANNNVPSTASVVTEINPLYICGVVVLIVVIVALVLRRRKKDMEN